MQNRWRSQAGYALVEALASLVILAMIGGLVASGVGTGRRLWEHSARASDLNDTVEATHATLRNLLERIFPLALYDSSSPSIVFTGTPDHVEFLAPAPDSHRPSELQRYHLYLSTSGELVLSRISDLAADPDAPPLANVLLRNVQSFQVDYFGPAAPDNVRQWRPTWRAQPRLPRLIRMRVEFMPGDQRWWPTLIVRPAATIDLQCAHGTPGQCGALQ